MSPLIFAVLDVAGTYPYDAQFLAHCAGIACQQTGERLVRKMAASDLLTPTQWQCQEGRKYNKPPKGVLVIAVEFILSDAGKRVARQRTFPEGFVLKPLPATQEEMFAEPQDILARWLPLQPEARYFTSGEIADIFNGKGYLRMKPGPVAVAFNVLVRGGKGKLAWQDPNSGLIVHHLDQMTDTHSTRLFQWTGE